MKRQSMFVVLLMLVCFLFVLSSCAPEEAPEVDVDDPEIVDEPDDKTLVIAIPGDVETVDPGFGAHQRTNETLKNIYDQFFEYNIEDTGEGYFIADTTDIIGSAIESYEFSDDYLEVKLKVREGMEFVETGNPITAEDIYYKFERAFGLAASEAWVFNTAGVFDMDQVSLDGDYELTIEFEQPAPLFLPLLRDQCTGVYDSVAMKENSTDGDPWSTEWLARNYAGSGPYYVESWDRGEQMILAKNQDHWAADEDHPYFDKIVLRVVEDSTTRSLMLEEGSIDIAAELSPEELFELEGEPGVSILSIPSTEQFVLGVNFEHEPFDDIKLRQALAYAIPYDSIVDGVFRGEANKGVGPMSSLSAFYEPYGLGDFDFYDTDMDKAAELIEEAGYSPDELSFNLAIQSGWPVAEEIAILVSDSFGQIGVDVSIDKQSASVFAEKMANKEQEAFIRDYGAYVDDPFYVFFLFHETGTIINWTNYSNERVDEIVEETRYMVDEEQRRELYREAVELAQEEVAYYHLVEQNYMAATRDDIAGFVNEPDYLWRYDRIYRTD